MEEQTYFELGLKAVKNDDSDDFKAFAYYQDSGFHVLSVEYSDCSTAYKFDDAVVDEVNNYLDYLWLENGVLYDDMEEFLLDSFLDALEYTIDDFGESEHVYIRNIFDR